MLITLKKKSMKRKIWRSLRRRSAANISGERWAKNSRKRSPKEPLSSSSIVILLFSDSLSSENLDSSPKAISFLSLDGRPTKRNGGCLSLTTETFPPSSLSLPLSLSLSLLLSSSRSMRRFSSLWPRKGPSLWSSGSMRTSMIS